MRWVHDQKVAYQDAMQRMDAYAREVYLSKTEIVWTLHHSSLYTYGSSFKDFQDLKALPAQSLYVRRGGDITYHGPGQFIVYPFLPLYVFNNDLHAYMGFLEDLLIDVCAYFSVKAFVVKGKTGVFTDKGKVGFIGVSSRRWISMHGLSLNITKETDRFFSHIKPCGLNNVQSVSLESHGIHVMNLESIFKEMFLKHYNKKKSR
ncbi:MAG: lipoyl(octanoyl) transferase LipB [Alphaproteobacteria bacterium]|nr:lipoyl(octanoyl) transferase LipB [Alphaproteobacteria bacterium]